MIKGWLAALAIFAGINSSFAAEQSLALSDHPLWGEARQLLAEGKPAAARQAFDRLVTHYPEEPDLHLFLGIAQLRLREPDAATAAIQRAIYLEPNHAEARTLLGWVELEIRGDADAAIREYTAVVNLKPKSPQAYVNLGVAYKVKGDLTKALENYNRALELRPDFVEALSNRGWVFVERGTWDVARRDFDQALKLQPEDRGALQGLAQVLEKTRDYAGAQAVLSQLNSQSPNFVYWLQWGRIGLIRYWWVLLLIAVGLMMRGRFLKARTPANG